MTNGVTFDFSGAAVLVTGGTSGIGHAVATAFADAGAIGHDHRHAEARPATTRPTSVRSPTTRSR